MSVQFAKFDELEHFAVKNIAARAKALFEEMGVERTIMDIFMDLSAVHAHTPLRIEDMAEAGDVDFMHDIGGIARHLDRETGELRDCFVPRFAA